jgi:hypothetical protein
VHGTRPAREARAWLWIASLYAPVGFGAVFGALGLFVQEIRLPVAPVLAPLALALPALGAACLGLRAGAARAWLPAAVAAPAAALVCAAAWWGWLGGPDLDRQIEVAIAAGGWLAGAWFGLLWGDGAPRPTARIEPDPIALGGAWIEFQRRSAATTLALAVLSLLVWPLGALLAACGPRPGRRVVVRIAGPEIEIRAGREVARLSLAGGRVVPGVDALGAPQLELWPRTGASFVLALGDLAPSDVDAIAARLAEATGAPAGPPPEPEPEALRALRRMVRRTPDPGESQG